MQEKPYSLKLAVTCSKMLTGISKPGSKQAQKYPNDVQQWASRELPKKWINDGLATLIQSCNVCNWQIITNDAYAFVIKKKLTGLMYDLVVP